MKHYEVRDYHEIIYSLVKLTWLLCELKLSPEHDKQYCKNIFFGSLINTQLYVSFTLSKFLKKTFQLLP